MMNWHNVGWGMGFGWIFMLLFWTLVILGIAYIVQLGARRSGKSSGPEKMPLEILKKRYAKGEISKEEFERIRDSLMKS